MLSRRKQLAAIALVVFAACGVYLKRFHGVRKDFVKIPVLSWSSMDQCENVLQNMTRGSWKLTSRTLNRYHDEILRKYWRKKRMFTRIWREDGKCGFNNFLPHSQKSTFPPVAAWCDKESEKPCCDDLWNGVCSKPRYSTCRCKNCVDLRTYKNAEASRWETKDLRCDWVNYTGSSACDVIEKSRYDEIYFVGDSLLRNMFAAFLMLLSDDPLKGAWSSAKITAEQKRVCVGESQYFWKHCRQLVSDMASFLQPEKLCAGRKPKFTATYKPYYVSKRPGDFLKLLKPLHGKRGILVVIAIGHHMNFSAESVIEDYLEPVMAYFKLSAATDWPHFFYILPMPGSLLKPPKFISRQNNKDLPLFASRLRDFCRRWNVPVFDFRQLSENVHSFDGTHYGRGVNLMKVQVFLNYLAHVSHHLPKAD